MSRLYLVTGGSGHLGGTLINMLLSKGEKVRALLLPNDPLPFSGDAEIVRGNVCDRDSLVPFFAREPEQQLILLHCAGLISITAKIDPALYQVNVLGTKNIGDMALENNVSRMIYVSSVHAIPTGADETVIREISDFDPKTVEGAYAKTKAEATEYIMSLAKKGLNVSVVHPSGIMGPNDNGKGHLTTMILEYLKGKLTAIVRGGYDFVDVRDVADGILKCVDKGKPGECYILSNRYFSVRQIMDMLHDISGKKRVRAVLPIWFAKFAAPFAELYYKVRKQSPLFTRYSLYTLTANANFSHEKAEKELGYHTRSMADTLKDTVAYLKSHRRLSPKPRRRKLAKATNPA